MAGKLITCYTLACFITMIIGCTSQQDISREVLPAEEKKISEVVTTEGNVFSFKGDMNDNYARVEDTTIVGTLDNGKVIRIPMSKVARIRVMRFDVGKAFLWTVGGALAVGALVAATKQSCPFVYSYNGERFVFDGEPYGGSICEPLKRTDWCRLEHLKPVANEYRLLLTNEVDETQYTDEFKLWVVDHRPGLDVVVDSEGNLFTVDHPVAPLHVVDSKGKDLALWLSTKDELFWETDMNAKDPHNTADLRDTLYLTFAKPKEKPSVKLVVSASTTLWGSQMLKRMTELRGEEIPLWFNELKSPATRQMLDLWNKREELYHLQVKVRVGNNWVTRGDIMGGGPLVTEDRIVPLYLTGIVGDTLVILLAPPAGFWQLNSFGIDYSTNEPVDLKEISAAKAVGHDGTDLLGTLDSTDGKYYAAPEKGQTATLVFREPPEKSGRDRAVFAKVSGYYDMHLKAVGATKHETINRVAFEPGYPAKFALQEFLKWKAELLRANQTDKESGQ